MNFAHFCVNSGVFFLRKTSTIHISNFCSGMPLRKVHELTFLWFGLPGPLLIFLPRQRSGTCLQNSRDIPGSLLRNSRTTNFWGWKNRPPTSACRGPPPHPAVSGRQPKRPGDRKKFILARTHEKTFPHARNFHSRLKFSFSVWNFHSRLKISIPGPVFLRPERGPEWKFHSRLKISFCIESLIFSISPLEIAFFQSWGPLGFWGWKNRHLPLRVEDPHPTRQSRDPKG